MTDLKLPLLTPLKPCPFCGNADATHTEECFFTVWETGNGDPVEAWNKRALFTAPSASQEQAVALKKDRPAKNPGGVECERCGCIFIGEEWHSLCGICFASPPNAGTSCDQSAADVAEEAISYLRQVGARLEFLLREYQCSTDEDEALIDAAKTVCEDFDQ